MADVYRQPVCDYVNPESLIGVEDVAVDFDFATCIPMSLYHLYLLAGVLCQYFEWGSARRQQSGAGYPIIMGLAIAVCVIF